MGREGLRAGEGERTDGAPRAEPDLLGLILDSLDAHVAVLDARGVITAVNEPWRRRASAFRPESTYASP